jgi:hypothetical protein
MEAGEIRALWLRVEARIWGGMSVREKARWRGEKAAAFRAAGISPDAEVLGGLADGPGHGEVSGGGGDGGLGALQPGGGGEGAETPSRAA